MSGRSGKHSSTGPLKSSTRFVSVKTLAEQWDCSRTTVSRLLEQAGVRPFYFGVGRNGSKRYLKEDVDRFLQSVERPE